MLDASGREPVSLIAEIVVGGVRVEEILERPHERSGRVTGTNDAGSLREDDAVVLCARVEGPPVRDGEVPHVLGDDGPTLQHGQSQKIEVGSPAKVIAFANRDDVVTPTAKLGGDSGIVVLVEEELQRTALCSLRHAASSSVASASFAAIHSSISWRFAA